MDALPRMFRLDQIPRAANGRRLLLARSNCILLCLIALSLTGCRTDRRLVGYVAPQAREQESEYYWGRATFLNQNSTVGSGSAEEWSRIASDHSVTLEGRRFAAAFLLAFYVQPGFDAARMRDTMKYGDTRWVQECSIEPILFSSGDNPLLLHGWHFRMWLFPDATGRSEWHVYFTLAGHSIDPKTPSKTAEAFFRGDLLGSDLKLTEFTLYCRLPEDKSATVIERHCWRGVGIKVRPDDRYMLH